jgi:hypothetical protein
MRLINPQPFPPESEIAREMEVTGFDRLICIRRVQDRAKIKHIMAQRKIIYE